MKELNKIDLENILSEIEHPEIANKLTELGMMGNADINHEVKEIYLTLVLPMITIPIEIRDMILTSITTILKEKFSGYKLKVSFDQMNDEQKTNFFALSKQNWKL